MAWLPVRAGFVRLLAGVAERALRLLDRPPLLTSLVADGDDVALFSYLTGLERPLAIWSAANLHILVLASAAAVLASPLRGRLRRLRLLGAAVASSTAVAALVCVAQVLSVLDETAATNLGLTLASAGERAVLAAASRGLVMIGMLLVPAGLFLVTYLSSWSGPSSWSGDESKGGSAVGTPARGGGRRAVPMGVLVSGIAAAAIAVFLVAAARTPGPADYLAGLEKVRRLNPLSARARCSLGVFYEAQGEPAKAATAYREAAALDPGLALAHYGLGNVLFRGGSLEEAAQAYRRALTIDPGHVSAHQNLGIALFQQQDYDGAAKSFEAALRGDPRHAAAHHDLGLALMKLDRPCEALPHLEQGAALDRTFAGDAAVRAEISRLRSVCNQR